MDERMLAALIAHGRRYGRKWAEDSIARDTWEHKYFAIQFLYADLSDRRTQTPYSDFNGFCGITVADGRIISADWKDYICYPDCREE